MLLSQYGLRGLDEFLELGGNDDGRIQEFKKAGGKVILLAEFCSGKALAAAAETLLLKMLVESAQVSAYAKRRFNACSIYIESSGHGDIKTYRLYFCVFDNTEAQIAPADNVVQFVSGVDGLRVRWVMRQAIYANTIVTAREPYTINLYRENPK